MNEAATGLPVIAVTALVLGPLVLGLVTILINKPLAADVLALALATALAALLVPLSDAVLVQGPVTLNLGGHRPPIAIPLYADGLTLAMVWLTTLVALSVHGYAAAWLRWIGHPAGDGYRALWPFLWSGLNGLFLSADLFNLYVMLEVTTLGAVSLVMLGRATEAVGAAARYLFFALVGSILFLLGVALVYAYTGLLYMPLLAGSAAAAPGVAVALLAITAGAAMKAALFPVHAWLPAAHASAPTPASALLSGLVATAGVYLLLRIWLGPFAGAWSSSLAQAMGWLGAAGIAYGSVQALYQSRIKVIVAYSTVAQLGYLLLLIPLAASSMAWNGAIYHMAAHGLAKAGIFLAAGNLILAVGGDELERLPGADRVAAGSLVVIGVAGASIAGLPPTGGFVAKWWLLSGALEQGQWWWVPVLALGGLLAAAYIFRILHHAFRRPDAPGRPDGRRPPRRLLWPPALLALAALALGFTGDILSPFLAMDSGGAGAS